MRVLVLNGASLNDSTAEMVCSIFQDELLQSGHQMELVNLRDKQIAGCLGCFGCWIKTPGECIINDEGRRIAKSVIQSDLVVNVTPLTFGGYSSESKKALDRLIPIISPFFIKINGEVHHKPRYARYPNCLSLGIASEFNEEMFTTFRTLVKRNAINMHNKVCLSSILVRNQSVEEIKIEIRRLLKEAGVWQ